MTLVSPTMISSHFLMMILALVWLKTETVVQLYTFGTHGVKKHCLLVLLCLFIQDRYGISVGKTQMGIDVCILFASFFFVSPWVIGVSVLGTAVLNIVLAMNHKPTRYSVNYAS